MAWLTALIGTAGLWAALTPAVSRATSVCPVGTSNPIYCFDVAPVAVTGDVNPIGATTATLHGRAGSGVPNGDRTSAFFEWGLTRHYGTLTASHTVPTAPPSSPVSTRLRGLDPCTIYHYAIVATNRDNTTIGSDSSFLTGFANPLRRTRVPRHPLVAGARFRLRGTLRWPARVRVSIRQGRQIVSRTRTRRRPAGRFTILLHAPALPGRYSVDVAGRLSCGAQRLAKRLLVSPPAGGP